MNSDRAIGTVEGAFAKSFALFLLLFIGGFCPFFLEAQNLEVEALQQLKNFTSHPPVIKQITFDFRNFAGKTNYYLLRWQTNAFVLQGFSSKAGLDSQGQSNVYSAYGRYNNSYWTYTDDMGLSEYQRTSDSSSSEKTNGIYQSYRQALNLGSRVMNMGVPNLNIGSIIWDGDVFNITNDMGVVWSGHLELSTSSIPSGISLSAMVLSNRASYVHHITYRYGKNKGGNGLPLPEGFEEKTMLDEHSWLREGAVNIYQIITNDSALTTDWFDFAALKRANNRLWVFTNGQMFVSLEGNKNGLAAVRYVLPGSAEDPYRGVNYQIRRFVWAGVVAFVNFFVLTMLFLAIKRQKGDANERKTSTMK